MFLRLVLVLFLCGFSFVCGQNKFLNKNFWQTATVDVVRAELKAGARVNAKNMDGMTPLMAAVSSNTDVAVIKSLLSAGADLESRTENGWTPLMLAVRDNKNLDVTAALLEAGANAKAKDDAGKTALDYIKNNEALKDNQALQDMLLEAMRE